MCRFFLNHMLQLSEQEHYFIISEFLKYCWAFIKSIFTEITSISKVSLYITLLRPMGNVGTYFRVRLKVTIQASSLFVTQLISFI